MARDDFPARVKALLGRRAGYKCSNPECRQPTSGPSADPTRATNIGVAAHITAASSGGPRYDPSLAPQQRRSAENGIWCCPTCGTLVDADGTRYPVELLRDWKRRAEEAATRDLQRRRSPDQDAPNSAFAKLERLMPELLTEMRRDLEGHPLTREFVVLRKNWIYNSDEESLTVYYYEDHSDLEEKLRLLENRGLVVNVTYNNTLRYVMSEDLAEYLCPS